MSKIKASSIEEVRGRVGVYDLISQYVDLHRSGSKYKGLSPFKHEKTPSFFVDPAKNMYYCFSSSQGGDIFKFVMVKENLNFPEAVEFIANKFNIRLEYEDGAAGSQAPSYRKQLFEIHELSASWYAEQFFAQTSEAAEIRDYWVGERGFTLEEARELRIGYAPTSSVELKKILSAKKYSPEAIIGSGIFYGNDRERDINKFYPRFCGRIIIPILDVQGRVIAFTARKTRFTPQKPSEEGKYVNSRDTDIFKKNTVVFNIDKAKNPASEKKYFIVVEGQLDALRMYCSGLKNAVATQGTAAGYEHFAAMKRYADKVVLLFDGDSAGRRAALRVIPICYSADIEPFVAVLPPDEDPDSFIKKNGPEAMRELVEQQRTSALKFAAGEILADTPNPSSSDKRSAMLKLFEILAECKSEVIRNDSLLEIAANLKLDAHAVHSDWKAWIERKNRSKRAVPDAGENDDKKCEGILTNAYFDTLLVCLNFENVAEALSKILRDQWIVGDGVEARALKRLMALYREGIGFSIDETDSSFDDKEEKNLIYKIALEDKSSIENPVKYANNCMIEIYRKYLDLEKRRLNELLQEADMNNSPKKFDILKQLNNLSKEARTPPARIEVA